MFLIFLPIIGVSQNITQESYKTFELSNKIRYEELTKAIRKLPINACITKEVKANIVIDEEGNTAGVSIVSGTSYFVLDSIVEYTIMNFEGRWIPLMDGKKGVKFNQNFGFTLFNVYSKKTISKGVSYEKASASNGLGGKYKTVTHSKEYDLNKNCEDNEYYYLKGVEEYKSKQFILAKSSFIDALDSNPYDLDSKYNLGMCYLMLEKIEKACECFEECSKYGDEVAMQQLNNKCKK